MVTATATRYPNHLALAQLPYFELRDGDRLAIADPDLGPVIDVHTHLALSYGRRSSLDLWTATERMEHYLSLDTPLDLDVYMNKNFSKSRLTEMKRDLGLGSFSSGGMRATHTAGNLLREMEELNVASSVLLPIDFPILSRNAETYLDIVTRTEHLISLASVHPHASRVGEKLAEQKALGARGVKLHPAVQLVAPDHPRAMAMYPICAELDLPVLFHCGPVGIEPRIGRYLSQLKHYWRSVAEHPNTTFVLGHSGALQMEQALTLAKQYDNVYLEVSCQSLTNVRRIVAEAPPDRIMLGSDWPFYHQGPVIAKVLLATEGNPDARRRVLWENAARLFRIEPLVGA